MTVAEIEIAVRKAERCFVMVRTDAGPIAFCITKKEVLRSAEEISAGGIKVNLSKGNWLWIG